MKRLAVAVLGAVVAVVVSMLLMTLVGCDQGPVQTITFNPDRNDAWEYDPSEDPSMLDGSKVRLGNFTSSATDDKLFVKARDLSADVLRWVDDDWELTSISLGIATAQEYRLRIGRGQAPQRALAGVWQNYLRTLSDRYYGCDDE